VRRLALGLIVIAGGACKINPYRLEFTSDGGTADVNTGPDAVHADAGPDAFFRADGGPDACVPEPEICDHKDNNCNGFVDEGFNFDSDPNNCGDCGITCSEPGASGTCVSKQCQFVCQQGYHDLNGDLGTPGGDGCEYFCIPTNNGVEACDGIDNDCDGVIDNGIDKDNDPNNCGSCGHQCTAVHATATCSLGVCGYDTTCAGGTDPNCVNGCDCDTGTATGSLSGKCFADIGGAVNGCQYQCPVFPVHATEDLCNNLDDNCDGQIDEGNPQGGTTCVPDPSWAIGAPSTCTDGIGTCVGGKIVCGGYTGPVAEKCDGKDNNCDGTVDDGFDLQNDPNHCGGVDPATGLCKVCSFPHAVAKCTSGTCGIAYCLTGFVDLDGNPANGCEYACTKTGPEVCDGVDNDCDGIIDNPSKLTPPAGLCATRGACAGTTPTCEAGKPTCADTSVTWRCDYGPDVQTDNCGNIIANETLCDGKDNDCDGVPDDPFTNLNKPCDDGKLGQCEGTGTYVCTADKSTTMCNITKPGKSPAANDATCDGVDDDCDGVLDEDAVDDMKHIVASGQDFYIDTYEASHPDATLSAGGSMTHRSCSKANVIPWTNVTQDEAAAACAAGGMRLCTETEWQMACEGPAGTKYPYGSTYKANACNGADYDPDCTPPDSDVLLETGHKYGCPASTQCLSGYNVADLSGNAKEWTGTEVSTTPVAYRVRGGSYFDVAPGLTCDFNFVSLPDTDHFPNVGFRCCKTGP
jgi:hypothetical protein